MGKKKPTILVPVISCGRSGSRWLIQAIAGHPRCVNGRDVLSPPHYRDFPEEDRLSKKINALEQMTTSDKDSSGDVYVFTYHFQHWDKGVNDYLLTQNTKAILLTRNPVDITISVGLVEQAEKGGVPGQEARDLPYRHDTLELDPEKLGLLIEEYERWCKGTRYQFPVLHETSYEEMLQEHDCIWSEILDFIGLEHCELNSPQKRQRTKSRRNTVTNYDAVLKCFQDSQYSHYFKDKTDLGEYDPGPHLREVRKEHDVSFSEMPLRELLKKALFVDGQCIRRDVIVRFMAVEHWKDTGKILPLYEKLQLCRMATLAKGRDVRYDPMRLPRLIASFAGIGFNRGTPIILGRNEQIIEGAHRLACCMSFGIEIVPIENWSDRNGSKHSTTWFRENFTKEENDVITRQEEKIRAAFCGS
jgi:hypothetical protein